MAVFDPVTGDGRGRSAHGQGKDDRPNGWIGIWREELSTIRGGSVMRPRALGDPRRTCRGQWLLVRVGAVMEFDCIAALKALGEETRLRILRQLFKERLSVNEIAERLGVSQYNVSKHLRVMREAGLLEVQKSGKLRLYGVPCDLKKQLAANNNVLDLGCCTFRFDKLPK